MQKPFINAVVGKGRRESLSSRSQPTRVNSSASSALSEAGEFLDVGAGDEAVLARADDQARGLRGGDLVERGGQLLERLAREGVRRSPLPVESRARRAPGGPCPSGSASSERLHQHRAAQPAADADRGDAAPGVVALERLAAGAARCARPKRRPDGRAPPRRRRRSDLSSSSAPSAPSRPSCVAAVGLVLPGGEAGEHLRREGLVDLPVVEVVEPEAMALQDRRRGVHRPQAHLRRVEARPLASRRCARAARGRGARPPPRRRGSARRRRR